MVFTNPTKDYSVNTCADIDTESNGQRKRLQGAVNKDEAHGPPVASRRSSSSREQSARKVITITLPSTRC